MKWLIRLYQKTISPDHGPLKTLFPNGYCRFYPSCSEFAYHAIDKHGPIKGCYLALKRLLSCHPYGKYGYDPVPDNHEKKKK